MKRKADKTTWRAKLTDEGIQYLEEYRLEKLKAREEEQKTGHVNLFDRVAEITARSNPPAEPDPKLKELFAQDPGAAEQYEKIMREIMGPIPPPAAMDLWNGIHSILEQAGPEGRKAISMMLAIGVRSVWSMYHEVRKRHFGNSPINNREFFWIAGTALRNYGNVLRTGEFELTTKGRVNVELLDLIQEIRRHEKMGLTYRELKDALEYVLVYTPTEEWLRLFVHRARRKGWLT